MFVDDFGTGLCIAHRGSRVAQGIGTAGCVDKSPVLKVKVPDVKMSC